MKPPSEQARLVLERYKEATALGSADKVRLGDVIRERVAHGDLPRFDIHPTAPLVTEATLGSSIFAKIGIAALVLGAAGGVGYLLQKEPQQARRDLAAAPTHEPATLRLPASALPDAPETAIENTAPEPPAAGSLPPVKAEKKRTEAAAPSASVGEPTIDEEVKLVTAAQAALRAGDTSRALTLLNEDAKRFPTGKLVTLRQVTHMMALCQSGRAELARQEARTFLAKNPSSPFAERVNGICSTAK